MVCQFQTKYILHLYITYPPVSYFHPATGNEDRNVSPFYRTNVDNFKLSLRSVINFWKSLSDSYVSKSFTFRRAGMFFGRGSANGTGNSSGITEWCVIKARNEVNSFVKPYKNENN